MKLVAIVLVGAIAFAPVANAADFDPPAQQQPNLTASTKQNGKGIPYGRSDSSEPFFKLAEVSTDPTYGYTEANPIKVGTVNLRAGPSNEKRFLNGLRSSAGEAIEFERMGSCCPFDTKNGIVGGGGLLDVFMVIVPGAEKPRLLYINMYDPGALAAPMGFSIRSN